MKVKRVPFNTPQTLQHQKSILGWQVHEYDLACHAIQQCSEGLREQLAVVVEEHCPPAVALCPYSAAVLHPMSASKVRKATQGERE